MEDGKNASLAMVLAKRLASLEMRREKITVVKAEETPRCCRNFTMVAVPLHHGGVFTAPWWSFDGAMVEWHRHRGVLSDFTMVEFFLHHGVFSKSFEERSKIRKELTFLRWISV